MNKHYKSFLHSLKTKIRKDKMILYILLGVIIVMLVLIVIILWSVLGQLVMRNEQGNKDLVTLTNIVRVGLDNVRDSVNALNSISDDKK